MHKRVLRTEPGYYKYSVGETGAMNQNWVNENRLLQILKAVGNLYILTDD